MDLYGSFNIFEGITRYIDLRKKLVMSEVNKVRFFAATNPKGTELNTFMRYRRWEKTKLDHW